MNQEQSLNILANFVSNRITLLHSIKEVKFKNSTYQVEEVDGSDYTKVLMQSPISKVSNFSDMIWDFNEDYPNVARSMQGTRLRINFSNYSAIPTFVIIEIKVLLNLAILNNLIFQEKFYNRNLSPVRNSKFKSNIKIQTLTPRFKAGLSFFNQAFKEIRCEYGNDYVDANIKSLTDITYDMYAKAAKNYEKTRGFELEIFFKYLYSPSAQKYIFKTLLPYINLNEFEWKKLPTNNKKRKNQVLPNNVFETISQKSTFIILDFLNAMKESKNISDISSLERFVINEHHSYADKVNLNRETFFAYVSLRLKHQNYKLEYTENIIEPFEWKYTKYSKIRSAAGLKNKFRKNGFPLKSIYKYLNLVSSACTYIIGQYTGMRLSELAEINVQDCKCLVNENGIWVIKSSLKKNIQETHTGLFDNYWIAIPIVRDAVLAASYISKFKASPYLLSSIYTVAPTKRALALNSNGVKNQINRLFTHILGKEVASEIDFNTHMFRHTLAHQLFRADVGLPLISFQLKHFVNNVAKYTSQSATSTTTLGYGEIGEMLSQEGSRKGDRNSFRHKAELEMIKISHNPKGVFYGGKATELKERLNKLFKGYQAAGYTEDEVYQAMLEQGIGVVNVGQGLCYGGKSEEYDESLPCIGSLRCNPARCKEAVVTKSHAPKWREVYTLNKANLNKPEYAYNREQILAIMNEARVVLENLGEEVEL